MGLQRRTGGFFKEAPAQMLSFLQEMAKGSWLKKAENNFNIALLPSNQTSQHKKDNVIEKMYM